MRGNEAALDGRTMLLVIDVCDLLRRGGKRTRNAILPGEPIREPRSFNGTIPTTTSVTALDVRLIKDTVYDSFSAFTGFPAHETTSTGPGARLALRLWI